MSPVFGFLEGALSPSHILIVLAVGLLLFGKRLPEIGRYLGKGIVEFKKGMAGLEDELGSAVTPPPQDQAANNNHIQPPPPRRVASVQAPRFEDKQPEV